jgi:hypothetical protein
MEIGVAALKPAEFVLFRISQRSGSRRIAAVGRVSGRSRSRRVVGYAISRSIDARLAVLPRRALDLAPIEGQK